MLILFAGIVFWVGATREPYYITPASRLILMSAPVGVVVALFALRILYKKPGEKLRIGDRLFSFTSMIVGFTLMISCIAAHINETDTSVVTRELRRPVVAKWQITSGGSSRRRPESYISCRVEQKRVDFRIPLELWRSLDEGDIMLLRLKEGALGVNFVDDIRPVNDTL
jgi:hypothetical protein